MEKLEEECLFLKEELGFTSLHEEEEASLKLLQNIQDLNNYKDVTMALLGIIAERRQVGMGSLFSLFEIEK